MPVIVCDNCGIKNRVELGMAAEKMPRCGKCGTPLNLDKSTQTGNLNHPLVVTDSTFQHDVLNAGDRPVLLDCWAEWCGPCRMITPILDQLAVESGGRYVIAKLNVDENPRTAAQFQIRSIPTLLIFKNGQLVDRLIGAQPKQAIVAHLARAA